MIFPAHLCDVSCALRRHGHLGSQANTKIRANVVASGVITKTRRFDAVGEAVLMRSKAALMQSKAALTQSKAHAQLVLQTLSTQRQQAPQQPRF